MTTSASPAKPTSSSSSTKSTTYSSAASILKTQLELGDVKELWYAVSAFIAVLAVARLVDVIVTRRRLSMASKQAAKQEKDQAIEPPTPSALRKPTWRRIPEAILSAWRIVAFRSTIPIGTESVMTLSELAITLGYVAGVLILDLAHTQNLNIGFWDDRASHLGSSQIPLIVALSAKNNIISALTGISFEKLHVIHRAAGRTLVLMIWLHCIAHMHLGVQTILGEDWLRYGVVGFTSVTLAAILSIRPLRWMAYEAFLVSHITLVLITIVFGLLHRPDYAYYFWPGLLLWGLDRSLRLLRLFIYNCRLWRQSGKYAQGTVELISGNTVRLTLRRPMTWKAGQHAYVILPTVSTLPFEAHPFSISSIPGSLDGKTEPLNDLVFLIRGRSGFTKRLQEHATGSGHGPVTALVDGPYGYPPELNTFSTCVLVAGGSGISYTLPLLMDVVRNARLGKSNVRRILFIWVVRDPVHLKWISNLLIDALNTAPETLTIDPRIYITGGGGVLPSLDYNEEESTSSQTGSVDEKERKKTTSQSIANLVRTEMGRPNVQDLLQSEIESAHGRVSVDVAGPSALTQSVRKTLRSHVAGPLAVLKGAPTVSLHVETFGLVGA